MAPLAGGELLSLEYLIQSAPTALPFGLHNAAEIVGHLVAQTHLDYGSSRVRAYDEQGAEASLKDAMDQLDEARDVALLRLAKYQQALRRYHSRRVRGRAFNVEDLVLHLI